MGPLLFGVLALDMVLLLLVGLVMNWRRHAAVPQTAVSKLAKRPAPPARPAVVLIDVNNVHAHLHAVLHRPRQRR